MSTKKRFYTDIDGMQGFPRLWDRTPVGYSRDRLVLAEQRSNSEYLDELCDLLNKGHEATEAERLRALLLGRFNPAEALAALRDGGLDGNLNDSTVQFSIACALCSIAESLEKMNNPLVTVPGPGGDND